MYSFVHLKHGEQIHGTRKIHGSVISCDVKGNALRLPIKCGFLSRTVISMVALWFPLKSNVKLAFFDYCAFLSATVHSYNKRFNENSNFPVHAAALVLSVKCAGQPMFQVGRLMSM